MPPESLTLAVTSGFGVGIIAGIVSGVCYIIVHGFVGKRPRNPRAQWHCSVCGGQFRSIEGVLDTERVVTCKKCGGKICRVRCSNRDPQVGWICKSCQHPESWFKGILKVLHPNFIVCTSKTKMDPNRIDEIDEDLEDLKKKEKEQVRDFIERLVEAMLGGSIDNTSISRVYNDQKYDIIISRYHADLSSILTDLGSALHMSIANLPIIGQSPCSAHSSLKLLIQRIIQEAIGLPTLKRAQEHPGAPAEDINRSYEDLLATAILNKVIQNYQDDLPTSSANSVSSRLSSSSRQNDKEYFFGEETLESKWKNGNSTAADVDTTSVSSLDDWVRSDSSVGSTKFVDHMSLTIQQRIEEVSSSDDEAIVQPVHKNTLAAENAEWQNNWVMQKRKFGGSASPVPVPMLVPNPTAEAKVLIGDRDAEDTTDLSDAGSDYGDAGSVQGIESILVDSKTVIGGKNLLVNVGVEDEAAVSDDGSTDTSDIALEKERVMEQFTSNGHDADTIEISETINSAIINQAGSSDDNSPTSLDSHTEQDTEYTEKYATLPRTILKSPTPTTRDLKSVTESFANHKDEKIPAVQEAYNTEVIEQSESKQNGHHDPLLSNDEDSDQREKFKGSYSEREKEKWKNAVEMKNNPYSAENLNRRLSTQSSNSSTASNMFGRDYYVREAAKSAGARKKLASNEEDEAVEENVVDEPAKEQTPPVSSVDSSFIFKAVPAVIETDSPQQTDNESSIEVASPIRTNLLELSSDSDLSVERVYNLHSGKVYEKVGDKHQEIDRAKSPEIIKYVPTNTEFGTSKLVLDENHNATTNDRKRDFLRSLTQTDDTDMYSPVSTPTKDEVFMEKPSSTPNYHNSHNTNDVPFTTNEISSDTSTPEKPMVEESATNLDTSIESYYPADSIDTSIQEFSLVYSTDGQGDSTSPEPSSLNVSADPEIVDLKDKHLVKNRLGQFSKSYPNLAAVPLRKTSGKKEDSPIKQALELPEETSPRLVRMLDKSVTDLRKQFDHQSDSPSNKEDLSKKPVYSLTARSIPREFRQELKGKENGFELKLQNSSISTTEDNIVVEEQKTFPNAKSRIQFFENLKK